MLVANAASVLAGGFAAFATLQAIVGFFGGSLYSLSLTVLSDGRHPDRNFGLSLAAQVSFQVFGLLAGPAIARHGGIDALLWLFAGLCALGLVLVPMLPPHGRRAADAAAGARVLGVPILLALAGCFLFFFNVGCYWTYIELIGSAAGLSLGDLANGLALGVAFGIPGALLASWLGERRGRWLPIALSAAMTVVAATLLSGTLRLPAFVASTVLYNFAWNLSLAYQYSVVNAVDRSGRGVALAPAFHAAGGAAGPAVAALFVNEHDHGGVIWLVSASVLGSLACFSQALRLRTRGFRAVPATIDPRNS
jgi:predicted MFS family arabinose efflux permease